MMTPVESSHFRFLGIEFLAGNRGCQTDDDSPECRKAVA